MATPFMVYQISTTLFPSSNQKDVWKYGISSVGNFESMDPDTFSRPQSQLGACAASNGGKWCSWSIVTTTVGWIQARNIEADLIQSYVDKYGNGQCPPRQLVSCR
jgi:hypothetical protein